MSFTHGQVIEARRTPVGTFERGWYVDTDHTGHHRVYLAAGGEATIADANIRVAANDIHLRGAALVFADSSGNVRSIMPCQGRREEMIADFTSFKMMRLVAVIDLDALKISLTSGQGLMPDTPNPRRRALTPVSYDPAKTGN